MPGESPFTARNGIQSVALASVLRYASRVVGPWEQCLHVSAGHGRSQNVARRKRRLWWETPRQRVRLMLLVADNAERMHDADRLLADLRALIQAEECQADGPTNEWRLQGRH